MLHKLHTWLAPKKMCSGTRKLTFLAMTGWCYAGERVICEGIEDDAPGDSKCPFHPLVGGHLTP